MYELYRDQGWVKGEQLRGYGGVYLILGPIQLMGIIQKPPIRTRFTIYLFLETSLFAELVSQGKF